MTSNINNNLAKLDHVSIVAKLFQNDYVFSKTGFTKIRVHDLTNVFKVNRNNINQDTIKMYGNLSKTPLKQTQFVNDNNIYNMLFLQSSQYDTDWVFDYINKTVTAKNHIYFYIWTNNYTHSVSLKIKVSALNSFPSNKITAYAYDELSSSWKQLTYDEWTEWITISSNSALNIYLQSNTIPYTFDLYDSKGKPNGIQLEYQAYESS